MRHLQILEIRATFLKSKELTFGTRSYFFRKVSSERGRGESTLWPSPCILVPMMHQC